MANDEPLHPWRNFAVWSAVGAAAYVACVWSGTWLLNGDPVDAILRSKRVALVLSLGLILSMAAVGASSRRRPANPRNLRNFVIKDAAAVVTCFLVVWGFKTLADAGALQGMGASAWVAAIVGAVLVAFPFLGLLAMASAHTGAEIIDEEQADELRERSRLMLCSLAWTAACGLLLVLLSLSGPTGVLSPTVTRVGGLALLTILVGLGIAAWRLSDELARTLSYEAGNLAFYLVAALGGGWAMLAHLGFVVSPAPLDWLTMLTVLIMVASVIAVARRKLLMR